MINSINITLFFHYPETINNIVLEEKFKNFFEKRFNGEFNFNCYITTKSAPSNECELIVIDLFENKFEKVEIYNDLNCYIKSLFQYQTLEIKINYF